MQAVLPGATLTEFWSVAGMAEHNLPSEIMMPVGEMVDAALAGLELGEFATIPSLPDTADWDAFEAARRELLSNLSLARPASRYRTKQSKEGTQGGNFRQPTSMNPERTAKNLAFNTRPEDAMRF